MWLIEHGTVGAEGPRIPVPKLLKSALMRWFIGQGSRADEEAGIMLVQQARLDSKWIACDCRGTIGPPPILTPAFLSEAETYYLRRLTSRDRSEHHCDCPFFRDQATNRFTQVHRRDGPASDPPAYFSVLRPAPEKLARRPDVDASDDRTRQAPIPRLARLLWRLIDLAALNRCQAIRLEGPLSIAGEFRALTLVTRAIEVAPGIELARVFSTHPQDLRSRTLFAMLRALEERWPAGHEPQTFLALYAHRIQGASLFVAEGPPITLANRIQSLSTSENRVGGPYLVLIVVGQYPDARGYAALRGYAQPIYSGRRFLPIETGFERDAIRNILAARTVLDRAGIDLHLEKPLTEWLTPTGPYRPTFLLEARSRTSGKIRQVALELCRHSSDFVRNFPRPRSAGQSPQIFEMRPSDFERTRILSFLTAALDL